MGLLALNRLLSPPPKQRRRNQIRARLLPSEAEEKDVAASAGKRKGSPCQQDDDVGSQAGKVARMAVLPDLPEVVDAPMLPTKFLRLKHLDISLVQLGDKYRPYDYFSLVSFLDASPSLETLDLDVTRLSMLYKSVFADSQLRHMPEHRHGCLKSVKITSFSSAKSLIELTCYILKNAVSLECLTLDTIYGDRCYDESKVNRCYPMPNCILVETLRALSAIKTYIVHKNKVPSTVKLTVMEPCSKCHAKGLPRALSQQQQSCDVVVSV